MPTPVHQIWHGDSRELCKRFQTKSLVNCVITDPPFGINNLSKQAVTQSGREHARKIANDESPEVAMAVFNEVMDQLLPATTEKADLYIFTAGEVLSEWITLARGLSRHGFAYKGLLVWEKDGPGMGDLDSWGQGHEFILYLKKGRRINTIKRRSGVIHIPQLRPFELIHPHEKPTALLELLLQASTSEGDFVVDPFGGSGSLVRAARNIGRSAVGIEYDKINYDKAVAKLSGSEGLF